MTLNDFGLALYPQIKMLTVYTLVSVALQIKCLPVKLSVPHAYKF
jgi:hypothetical protein